MDNSWKKRQGMVYSTNPDFDYGQADKEAPVSLPPGNQNLYVSLDRKNRKGKAVTVVEGFSGREEDLRELGKELQGKCGAGGTVKEGVVLIQGDFRERIMGLLIEKGYRVKRSGG